MKWMHWSGKSHDLLTHLPIHLILHAGEKLSYNAKCVWNNATIDATVHALLQNLDG